MVRHDRRLAFSRLSALPRRAILITGAGTAALLLASPALAQTAAASSSADSSNVGEVVVTANKLNSTKVLDTPAAIQAISGAALQKSGVIGFLDVAAAIPGLSVQDLGPGDRKYIIRGISSTGESTTGVYYDEAVISGSNANDGGGFESDIRLYDLDHIEVLRGPQGTLYGAGSMSGTIRFITNKPNLTSFGGYVTGEASDTDGGAHSGGNTNFNGEVNIPIIDGKVALRAVGWAVDDSGYINQIRLGAGTADPEGVLKGINNDVVRGGRVALRIQPIDALTIDASYTNQSEHSNGSSRYTPAGVTAFQLPGTPTIKGCDLCNTDVTRSPSSDHLEVYSLTVAYKFQYGTLTGTTNQYNRTLDFNYDSTPILASFGVPIPAETLEPQTRDVNSTEIRYASDFDFPVNFVVGGFRQHETNNLTVQVVKTDGEGDEIGHFSPSNSEDALSNPDGNTFFGRQDDRTITQYAAFGEATWKVTPQLTVTGGLRYFTEDLRGIQQQLHPFGGFPTGSTGVAAVPDQSQSFNKVTFKGNISYKFNDAALVYATASEGFRGGGLNALSEPFEPIPNSYKPDSLWNYELGVKGRLFDGKLDYQADAFVIFWYGIQIQETTPDGTFNFTGNAGNAAVKGVEFELAAHPIEYLTVNLSGSFTDAYLTEGASPAARAINPTLGATGDQLPNVSPTQFALGIDYTRPLPMFADWKGTLAADITYRGEENAYFTSNPFDVPLKDYTLLNLRAGVSNGPWTATVFVRNATNARAQVSAINSTQDPDALLTLRPQTVGVSMTRTF
jgi:outer membrane receptor protein involved in Fe transport